MASVAQKVALETIDIIEPDAWQEIKEEAVRTAEGMLAPAVQTVTESDQDVERLDRVGELYSLPEGRDVGRYVAENTRGRLSNYAAGELP